MENPGENKQWFIGAAFFATAIAVHFLFGVNWLVRIIGTACLLTGLFWAFIQRIPVGWEGRAPSLYLTGAVAIIAGVIMGFIGLLMIFFAPVAACLIGWSASSSC